MSRVAGGRAAGLGLLLLAGCAGDADPGSAEGGPQPPPPSVVSAYFAIAFGDRDGPAPQVLRRWKGPVHVGVRGAPSYEDRAYLRVMVPRLSALTAPVSLTLDDERPDLELRFAPLGEIASASPEEAAAATGERLSRLAVEAGERGEIESCRAAIPSGDEVPQYMRLNLILEALVGCLGLTGTVPRPDESVFFAGPNWYEEDLAPIDLEVIRLHHAPDLAPGMRRDEVRAALHARLRAAR